MATVVEFVGVPGVGKTTLSMAVADELRDQGLATAEPTRRVSEYPTARRIATKSRYALEGMLRNPRNAIATARTVVASDQPSFSDVVSVLFNCGYVDGLLSAVKTDHGTVLFDQGPYQAAWSVGLRSGRPCSELLDSVLDTTATLQPDLVVLVTATEETVLDRLRSRSGGDSRLETDDRHLQRAVEGYDRLAARLTDSTRTPDTVTVVNETPADLEANVTRVANEIRNIRSELT